MVIRISEESMLTLWPPCYCLPELRINKREKRSRLEVKEEANGRCHYRCFEAMKGIY